MQTCIRKSFKKLSFDDVLLKKFCIFENNMHQKNNKKGIIHANLGGYIHLSGCEGTYINELTVREKTLDSEIFI
ncbi:MAG TPA: hypothetical protein DDY04_07195 [Bacteroidales bacterium]|nr:hypothetical protein [Bacteroidales bacterium]